MKIAIASGKGGTGKTLVATNLAAALAPAAYVDCDVEGANGHLFLRPRILEVRQAETPVPTANAKCTGCGRCAKACRFGAMAALKTGPLVFGELCHSCGACIAACPEDALEWTGHALGTVRHGAWRGPSGAALPFADGALATGEVRASALIREVKQAAGGDPPVTVLDCPPGAGCAAVEAVRGSDICLLVTEPTPFGLSDLDKAADLVGRLGVPHAVIVNRCDLGGTDAAAYCRARGLPIIAEIPYDADLARVYARGGLAYAESEHYRGLFDSLGAAVIGGRLDLRTPPSETPSAPPLAAGAEPDASRCTERPRPENLVQVAVISGKGGTGKTSLAASLAALADGVAVADCDVEAANLHLLLAPQNETRRSFSGRYVAEVDASLCRGCGVCAEACRFDAISMTPRATIAPLRCEGCGLCADVCPLAGTDEMPVSLRPRLDGWAHEGRTAWGSLARGDLLPGGEASGKLVTLVRSLAEERAGADVAPVLLVDASPGMGCPVNAALTGADLAVAVTEPTRSGLHDLERVLDLAAWFKVRTACVINKADISPEVASEIREACHRRGVEVIGEVPFDRSIPEDLARGRIPALGEGPGARALADVCRTIHDRAAALVAERPESRQATERSRR